jgi:hypothetical protein
LNYALQMPPTEANGVQDIMVDAATNQQIILQNYLNNRLVSAQNGVNYNPTIGFTPIGGVKGLNYPYKPFYTGLAPRFSIAWNPQSSKRWLNTLLGDKATVIRGVTGASILATSVSTWSRHRCWAMASCSP